jgi:hypothetical protein
MEQERGGAAKGNECYRHDAGTECDPEPAEHIKQSYSPEEQREKPHPVINTSQTAVKFDPEMEKHGVKKLIVRNDIIEVNTFNITKGLRIERSPLSFCT